MTYQLLLQFGAENAEGGEQVRDAILEFLNGSGVEVLHASPLQEAPSQIVIHTDGGCDRNKGGLGAWAYTAHLPTGEYKEEAGHEFDTTNNRMELTAAIRALESVEIGVPIELFSDSEYLVKGVTVWSRNWVRNGWKTAAGKAVINQDLWEELLKLYQVHEVTFHWLKGHAGNEFNERCDTLCTEAMNAAHKESLLTAPPIAPEAVGPL
ncbi:ribonuclease HI [Nitratireductor aquibiodomus]|uniref:ribonuclease HI n=1 Tax=Nitratireductor TaxID=245876 RepID=UPI000DE1A4F9|nr:MULTISPECIES: ribonuclease HI [Nitratireductor]MBN7763668.1 ribonuclease HI [Nitratireductor aquibiodomus]